MCESGLHLAPGLDLPREAVTQTFAILAKRGSGKTYTALVMVEEMLKAGLQVVVLDPVGVTCGLRSSADGSGPGLPIVVLGGDHGDVPLEPGAGEVIADFIIESGQPAILDLSLMRKGQQREFVTGFAEHLYHANRAAIHLVLDEADLFAPQRPLPGEQRVLGAIEDLVRRGRARGIGVTLVTQRAAVLNKDVLTQIEVLVALRNVAPQDREAIDGWVRVHGMPEQRAELLSSLAALEIGEAWIWSPGWLGIFQRVHIRRRETFDSSATPEVGAAPVTPRVLAPVDLGALRARIAATIERAQAEDPRELRRQIAELREQVAGLTAQLGSRPEPAPHNEEVAWALWEAIEAQVTDARAQERRAGERIIAATRIRRFAEALGIPRPATLPAPGTLPEPPTASVPAAPAAPRRANGEPTSATEGYGSASTDPGLKLGEQRMLETLMRRHPLKMTRAQLGTLSSLTPSGGTFSAYFSTLKRLGLITEHGNGDVEATDAAFARLHVAKPTAPQTPEAIRLMWREALSTGERRLFDALVAGYPGALTRSALGERAGYASSGGTFSAHLGVLRRNNLVEIEGEMIRASDALFRRAG